MKLEALYNAVIVKPKELETQRKGNIIVADLGNEKNKTMEVVAVGPGHYVAGSGFINTTVQEGDVVVIPTMGFTRFDFEGEEYFIGPENQLLAKITN